MARVQFAPSPLFRILLAFAGIANFVQIGSGLSTENTNNANNNNNNYFIQPHVRSERLQKWLAPNYFEHYHPYSIFNQVHLWDTPFSWETSPSSRRSGFNGKPQVRRRKQQQHQQPNYNTNSYNYGDAPSYSTADASQFAYDNNNNQSSTAFNNNNNNNVAQLWITTDQPAIATTTATSNNIVHDWPQQNQQPNFYEYTNNIPLNDAPQQHYQPPPPPAQQQAVTARRAPDTKAYQGSRARNDVVAAAAAPDDTAVSRYRSLQSSASLPRLSSSSSPSMYQQRSSSSFMKSQNPFSVLEGPSFSFSFPANSLSGSTTKGVVMNAAPLHSFSFTSPIMSANPGSQNIMYSSSSSSSGGNEKGPRSSSSSSHSMQWTASRNQHVSTQPSKNARSGSLQYHNLKFPPAPAQNYWQASMQVQQPPFVGTLQPQQQQQTKAQNNMRGPPPQPPLTVISHSQQQPSFDQQQQQSLPTKGETRILPLPALEPLTKSPPQNFGFGSPSSSFGLPPAPNNFASNIKAGSPPQQPGSAIYDQPTIRCYQCRVPTDRACGPASVVQPCAWVFQPDSCFNASVQYVPVEDGLTGIIPPSKAPEKVYDCKTTVSFPVMFLRHFHIGQNECKSYSGYTITTSAVVGGEQRDYKYELQGNICTCATDACNQA